MLGDRDFTQLIDDYINREGGGSVTQEFVRTVIIGELHHGQLFKNQSEIKCVRGNQDVK